jgi:gamma-glutamylcyclotransferase (GGCT)/AIG2-like uncharacterized protein YtfP
MKYFAYGSNMCTNQLRLRKVRSAKFVAVGTLPGYTLRFHKRSKDGSGKCNALHTGKESDKVVGVVFEIDSAEKPNLDDAEGLGEGYNEVPVDVYTSQGMIPACMYVADLSYIHDSLSPFTWYYDIVVGGAREHGLPELYVQSTLMAVKPKHDHDKDRETKNRKCLPCC